MLMEGEENKNGQKLLIVNVPGTARLFLHALHTHALNNATFSTEKNNFALEREREQVFKNSF